MCLIFFDGYMDLFKIKLNIWSNGFNIGYMTNFINLKAMPY